MASNITNDVITVDEFARQLPCSRTVAYQLYNSAEVRGFKVRGRIWIYASEVKRYREKCSNQKPKTEKKVTTKVTGARKPLPKFSNHLKIPD